MLNISFFIAAFTSISWLIFGLRYAQLSALPAGSLESLYHTVMVITLPIVLIWSVFFIIKSFYADKKHSLHIYNALKQIERSNDAVTALGNALLNTEIELKSSFALREFDTLISDTNEVLSDIIKRSNSISSTQMEHLWTRTAGGERWLIAKTFIETYNFQQGFSEHLLQKAQKDNLLKGSILEFHTRYRNLLDLLETFDRQKIFYNMIEYGALGKAFRILAPIADKLNSLSTSREKVETKVSPLSTEYHISEETLSFPSFLKERQDIPEQKYSTSAPQEKSHVRSSKRIEQDIPAAPTITDFDNTRTALHHLKAEMQPSFSAKKDDQQPKRKVISLDELEKEINASPENNYDEYAYPFGNWSDDKRK